MSVESFNALDDSEARAVLRDCCVSHRWIDAVVAARPFLSEDALRSAAGQYWDQLSEADWLEAFEGHPKIGDVSSLREKYASSAGLAAHEQSGVAGAGEAVLERLARGNKAYEERFGFIFIVCATGRSAAEMGDLLEARLHNTRDDELRIAAGEQRKILMIRLEKLL
ncbi:MAG: 2-oxo-4-hydroxy-4-carboxy-5-ureidoimidazoline decarboxylase [Pseudomonadota bacterium]